MICFMPFTYIEERDIAKITGALGPVAVCGLTPEVLPGHMRPWMQKKLLEVWYPPGLQADHLNQALREFRAWADMHRGRIGDMVDFHRLQKEHPPFVDDTQPTRISDQVRHYGNRDGEQNADPLFQAALFLAMAQEYDHQHDAVARDLGTVLDMEKSMLARLSGDPGDFEDTLPDTGNARTPAGPTDLGAYMTAQRVQAWARLADFENHVYSVYATTSQAVCEHILEAFPEARQPLTLSPEAGAEFYTTLEALSFEEDRADPEVTRNQAPSAGVEAPNLKLYQLVGVRPQVFVDRLLGSAVRRPVDTDSDKAPVHTLIGYLNFS